VSKGDIIALDGDAGEMAAHLPQRISESTNVGILYDWVRDRLLSNGNSIIRDLLVHLPGSEFGAGSLQNRQSTVLGRPAEATAMLDENEVIFNEVWQISRSIRGPVASPGGSPHFGRSVNPAQSKKGSLVSISEPCFFLPHIVGFYRSADS
jgi:hypothetical protein